MAKKPILTDDELDGGLPSPGAAPPPLPHQPSAAGAATRRQGATPPPPPPAPASTATRPLQPPEPDVQSGQSGQAGGDGSGRDASGHARPKTRIHGYGGTARAEADQAAAEAAPVVAPAVGWLVVTAGPGRGAAMGLVAGMNSIGRGDGNAAQVDFGDDTISREPHAFVTYDDETRGFHLSHSGKTNIVRLNDAPVLADAPLNHGDNIRIGATSLRFVALCGPDFDWSDA